MYVAWTKNLRTADEIQSFKNQIISSKDVLDRVIQLLNEEEATLDRSEIDPKNYDQNNWAYRQAHKNGYRAGLAFVKKLIDLDQQKE